MITAGGTREYIDPVRFISNASSGKMGYELAKAAIKAGHKVMLISANTNLSAPKGVKAIEVETSVDMFEAVKRGFERCDCLIMAAAVSDYAPVRQSPVKIKRGKKPITLKLKPTADILEWAAGRRRKNQLVIGFALEDIDPKGGAERKLREKKLDMIVANRPAAIGADRTSVWIMDDCGGRQAIKNRTKAVIAREIICHAEAKIYSSEKKPSGAEK